jgi:acyl-coenzyme A thioesterase PaaI-like protein
MGLLDRLRAGGTPADWEALAGRVPYGRFLGISVVREGDGLVSRLAFDEKLIGNTVLPALHGGVIGAFLETAAMFQVLLDTESEHLPKPITLTVAYLRSAGPRETFARATITKQDGGGVGSAWRRGRRTRRSRLRTAQGQFLGARVCDARVPGVGLAPATGRARAPAARRSTVRGGAS